MSERIVKQNQATKQLEHYSLAFAKREIERSRACLDVMRLGAKTFSKYYLKHEREALARELKDKIKLRKRRLSSIKKEIEEYKNRVEKLRHEINEMQKDLLRVKQELKRALLKSLDGIVSIILGRSEEYIKRKFKYRYIDIEYLQEALESRIKDFKYYSRRLNQLQEELERLSKERKKYLGKIKQHYKSAERLRRQRLVKEERKVYKYSEYLGRVDKERELRSVENLMKELKVFFVHTQHEELVPLENSYYDELVPWQDRLANIIEGKATDIAVSTVSEKNIKPQNLFAGGVGLILNSGEVEYASTHDLGSKPARTKLGRGRTIVEGPYYFREIYHDIMPYEKIKSIILEHKTGEDKEKNLKLYREIGIKYPERKQYNEVLVAHTRATLLFIVDDEYVKSISNSDPKEMKMYKSPPHDEILAFANKYNLQVVMLTHGGRFHYAKFNEDKNKFEATEKVLSIDDVISAR